MACILQVPTSGGLGPFFFNAGGWCPSRVYFCQKYSDRNLCWFVFQLKFKMLEDLMPSYLTLKNSMKKLETKQQEQRRDLGAELYIRMSMKNWYSLMNRLKVMEIGSDI